MSDKSIINVIHITTVHSRKDVRIFIKQCQSLSKKYAVHLIVADGKGDECINGISIIDIGHVKGRIRRMLFQPLRAYKKTKLLSAHIFHFHDPELLLVGWLLKRKDNVVFYDVHEDVEQQILAKHWIPKPLRKIVSFLFARYERFIASRLSGMVAATPVIKNKFIKINKETIDVCNYPIQAEFVDAVVPWSEKLVQVCYVGGVAKIRGINETMQASKVLTNIQFKIAGNFISQEQQDIILNDKSCNCTFTGFLDRKMVINVYRESMLGLVTLHPIRNYLEALPVKMFEYMAAGLPVIASNFPLWQDIIEKNRCGICVDPKNPSAIAKAITYLVDNPKQAEEMGVNALNLIKKAYNWEQEEIKLFEFYNRYL